VFVGWGILGRIIDTSQKVVILTSKIWRYTDKEIQKIYFVTMVPNFQCELNVVVEEIDGSQEKL